MPIGQADFSFAYHGQVAKDMQYAAVLETVGKYSPVMPNIKSLQQWIFTNPNNFKGITVESSEVSCDPTFVTIAPPTNRTPRVYEYEMNTNTCVRNLTYEADGAPTFFQDRRDTGMGGFAHLAGYEGVFAKNIMAGMGYDSFVRHWFSNNSQSTASIVKSAMKGVFTDLQDNEATTAQFGKAYRPSTYLASTLTIANTILVLDDLIDNSYITLRQADLSRKVLLVTPNVYRLVDAYYRSLTNSSAGFVYSKDGVAELHHRGYKLIQVFGWEESLSASTGILANDLGADTKALILLTTKDNIYSLTDDASDVVRFNTKHDEITKKVYYMGNYMQGAFIIDYSLCAFAKQNL
jgi:hypothetical protein